MQLPELRFFVGGLGVEATEPQLRTAFAEVGVTLEHVALIVNPATGFKRGFAFVYVSFSASGSAGSPSHFLERMRGVKLNGRKSTVNLVPRAPRTSAACQKVDPRQEVGPHVAYRQ
jgi:RNA recognition motif-containing protein